MGPLQGVKVVELAGIGPGPMCAMLLADMGATVIRVDRKEPSGLGVQRPLKYNLSLRNRKAIAVDLKNPAAVEMVLALVEQADALIEGFRPGVTERLGLGPDACLARNPRLVYGRMTGWGQSGPLAPTAGHDLGYLALTGVLHAVGRADGPPAPPLNIVGDFAGGSHYLALGILAGIIEARRSGQGQVIDAAIVDGAAHIATNFYGTYAGGLMHVERGSNVLDSGAHFYDVYECADGKFLAVAPIEPKFYAELLARLGIDAAALGPQNDESTWHKSKAVIAERIRTRSRDEWCAVFEGSDACVAPVLHWGEAPDHPHMKARGTFVEIDGVVQPMPAPRFSRTANDVPTPPAPMTPENTDAALAPWCSPEEIRRLRAAGVI
ncbi:MAG: CaiB/BaiF CoA transferase family protein [Gammaproteobacteria bacterium]